MSLTLDRMALDDVGANPQKIAAAIHDQLVDRSGPVPVFEIARALDIVEIRIEPLRTFEGALVTTVERGEGAILLNQNSNPQRRRFTAGHELMHFLSPIHRPTSPEGFWCGQHDMTEQRLNTRDVHTRQEAEANVFAIELLAPRQRITSYLRRAPDLAAVLEMSTSLDISKEAAARRYVECHRETLAVVFSQHGNLVYFDAPRNFPILALRKAMPLPDLSRSSDKDGLTPMEAAPADDWLEQTHGIELAVQTLQQQNGRAMTLLHVVQSAQDEDDGGIDDAYERFSRWGR